MTKRTSAVSVVLAALVAMTLLLTIPALAKRPAGHGKGKSSHQSKKNEASAYTEDNDTNDNNTPNNVADDGDNRHPSGKDRSVEHGGSGNQGNSASDPDDDGHGPDRSNGGADKPNGPGGVDLADQDGNNGCGNDDDFEDDNEGWCGHKPKKDKKVKDDVEGEVTPPAEECTDDETMPEGEAECGEEVPPVCTDDETMPTGTEADCGEEVPPVCTDDETMAGSETCGTDTPDDVLGEEIAQEDGGIGAPVIPATPGDDVLGVTIQRDAERSGDAVAASDEAGAPTGEENALPFTGSDVIPLLLVAFGLLITGVATTRIRKNDR